MAISRKFLEIADMKMKLAPGVFQFGEMECCAMSQFHGKCAPGGFLERMIKIFNRTISLAFIAGEKERHIYAHLARTEIDFLKSHADVSLSCGHTREEHIVALSKLSARLFQTFFQAA